MAISSLTREPLTVEEQKKNGAFYTDFRLAKLLAEDCRAHIRRDSIVVDFAAGTGILLTAVAETYKTLFPETLDEWLSKCLYAYDLSPIALRGATASLLSVSGKASVIKEMYSHWKVCDSLTDRDADILKADIVIGNPQWGKIKLSRHNFMVQKGFDRVYGSDYQELDDTDYNKQKAMFQEYAKEIKEKYVLLANAEPDMYMAFLQRAVLSVKPGGHISFLVPAGLIRSQGTQVLREYLINNGSVSGGLI